jgi:hypothetical protein
MSNLYSFFQVDGLSKWWRKRHATHLLSRWLTLWKRELLHRDVNMRRASLVALIRSPAISCATSTRFLLVMDKVAVCVIPRHEILGMISRQFLVYVFEYLSLTIVRFRHFKYLRISTLILPPLHASLPLYPHVLLLYLQSLESGNRYTSFSICALFLLTFLLCTGCICIMYVEPSVQIRRLSP